MKKIYKILLIISIFIALGAANWEYLRSRILVWFILFETKDDVTLNIPVTSYALSESSVATTSLVFGDVLLAAPWQDPARTTVSSTTARWLFEPGKKSITILSSESPRTQTTAKPLPQKTAKGNYEFERDFWRLTREDIKIFGPKEDITKAVLLLEKGTVYKCDELKEFENTHGIRGVICETKARPERPAITFFTPQDKKFLLLVTVPTIADRDTMIASLQMNPQ